MLNTKVYAYTPLNAWGFRMMMRAYWLNEVKPEELIDLLCSHILVYRVVDSNSRYCILCPWKTIHQIKSDLAGQKIDVYTYIGMWIHDQGNDYHDDNAVLVVKKR